MDKESIFEFSNGLCKFIREKIPGSNGLFRTETFDVDSERWDSGRCDPDDIGDFAPFMVWSDKLSGEKVNTLWVQKQVKMLNERLRQDSGLYYPFSDGEKNVKKTNFAPAYPQNHIDTLSGFNMLYRLTKNPEYYESNKALCESIARYAISRGGFVYGAVIPKLHMYFPKYGYLRHKPEVSGVFIEEFVNLYKINKDEKLLDAARRLARAWLDTKPFREYGVFVDQIYPFINVPAVNTSTLYKMHLNMVNGLVSLYSETKDASIRQAVVDGLKGLDRFKNDSGLYCRAVELASGKVCDQTVGKIWNNAAISTLIDAYEALEEDAYLESAEKCANFWVENQSDNGLFLEKLEGQNGWNECEVDSHSDMLVAVARLYKLTGKEKYKESAMSAVNALKLFRASSGAVYRTVDYEGGAVMDRTNELKFLGGTLKGLLSAYVVLTGTEVLDKETTTLLMRDR